MGCCTCTKAITIHATLCFGCVPTGSFPVSVTITQTAGGSFTASGTIDSSAGYGVTIPIPCPGVADFTYSVTWSATNFTSVTQTWTVDSSGTFTGASTPQLHTTSGNDCFPGIDCFDPPPSTVNVTFSHSGCGSGCTPAGGGPTCDGTYSVPLTSITNAGTRLEYGVSGLATSCPTSVPGVFWTVNIDIQIDSGANCQPNTPVISFLFGCVGPVAYTLQSTSGTYSCPITFTNVYQNNINPTCTVTVAVSE